jgi:N-acetylglucosaminyl-diphospho-decaprenol L-rhamnosyltransferase
VDPTIDVVVVTYNSRHVVGDLLASLPAALAGLPARTVVVDNGSTDGTRELLAARTDCLLVPSANDGYAAGVNRGVAALAGDGPILVLNPDVRLAPSSVRDLVEALRLPGTGVTAPRVLNEDSTLFPSLRREPTIPRALGLSGRGRPWLSETVAEPEAYETAHTVDWALGAALLVSRDCHDLLEGWDESFFLYSEETDFCLRARDRGLATRYVPTAVCTHIGGASGRSPRLNTMQVLNRVRLYRRRHGVAVSWAYFALALVAEARRTVTGNADSRDAVVSLLRPHRRPHELACAGSLLPS